MSDYRFKKVAVLGAGVMGAQIAAHLANAGVPVIGVPKTIDNDLVGTDCCPGFGSAAKFVATAICTGCVLTVISLQSIN